MSSHRSIDEVTDYFKSSDSLGVVSLVLLAQNETLPLIDQSFPDGLVAAHMQEFSCKLPCLFLTIPYPAGATI